jgi:hypothetical protein
MKFIDGNIMKGTERRLTMNGHEDLSKDNYKKLQDAYKHPFEKIPRSYFNGPVRK